jgi:hypothetical protein
MGGLAQALSDRFADEDDDDEVGYGLAVVQLKRALRGAAFARGSLYSLGEAATDEVIKELQATLKELEKGIFAELSRRREERGAADE